MRIKNFGDFDAVNENTQGGGNKFVLARVGNTPNMKVNTFLRQDARINREAIVMKAPGFIVSMFMTHLTKEALIQGLDALGIQYDLYQIVHTSGGSTGPSLVARNRTPKMVKAEMDKAIADERWEDAARLRDELAALEGNPTPVGNSESLSFEDFKMVKEEEEFVNGTAPEEFYLYVSQLVDHEIKELEAGEEERGVNLEMLNKIKDYLVQNNFYVAPEKPEGENKPEGE